MNTQTRSNYPDIYSILSQTQRLRVSDGEIKPVLEREYLTASVGG
ncbi:hypothetical protein QUB80_22590 [Chlorogloeopsis sp. ULAP01]|nr:hypothetical protein [Chlorogloeopsis sp. ULAP01]